MRFLGTFLGFLAVAALCLATGANAASTASYDPPVSEVFSSTTITISTANSKALTTDAVIELTLPTTFTIDYMAPCNVNSGADIPILKPNVDVNKYNIPMTYTVTGALTIVCKNFNTAHAVTAKSTATIAVTDAGAKVVTENFELPAVTSRKLTDATMTTIGSVTNQYESGSVRFMFPTLNFPVYMGDKVILSLPTAAQLNPGYVIHPEYSPCVTAGAPYDAVGITAGTELTLIAYETIAKMSEGFYIDCNNVTLSKAHDGVIGGSAAFYEGESTTLRGTVANITFGPVRLPTVGLAAARVIPQTATAGSVAGWLTLALRPLPVALYSGDVITVTLPKEWAVGTKPAAAPECAFSIGVKSPVASTMRATGVLTTYTAGQPVVLTVTLGDDAAASASKPLYVHCNGFKTPTAATAEATDASVVIKSKTSTLGVLAQNTAVTVNEIFAGKAPIETITQTFTVSTNALLPFTKVDALAAVVAAAAGVNTKYVKVSSQSLGPIPDTVANKASKKRSVSEDPVVTQQLTVVTVVTVPSTALYEDVLDLLKTASTSPSTGLQKDATAALGIRAVPSAATYDALPATCANEEKDGDETDVDCGGSDCGGCPNDYSCETGADCSSGSCVSGKCAKVNGAALYTVSSAVVALVAVVALSMGF